MLGPLWSGRPKVPTDPASGEEPVISMQKVMGHKAIAQQTQAKKPTTHKDEKIALVLFLTGGFTIWNIFL